MIAPVDAFSVRPAGRDPVATENVYGVIPPLTVMAALLKGTFTPPEVVAGHVSEGPPEIVKVQLVAAAVPFASFTWIVKLPDAVGVPVIAPVDEFSVRPAGSAPVVTENV